MAEIDHIILGARTLEEGAAYVEAHLGVKPQAGGQHIGFGTHNMLLGLGSGCFLEILAADPKQPQPPHPRPFGLDEPAIRTMLEAEPKLLTWVARTPALDAVVGRLGPRGGQVVEMGRGDLHWRMLFPRTHQDMNQIIPALIQWTGAGASSRIRDSHCRLTALEAEHPDSDTLRAALTERGVDQVVKVRQSPQARLMAHLTRQDGQVVTLSNL